MKNDQDFIDKLFEYPHFLILCSFVFVLICGCWSWILKALMV